MEVGRKEEPRNRGDERVRGEAEGIRKEEKKMRT